MAVEKVTFCFNIPDLVTGLFIININPRSRINVHTLDSRSLEPSREIEKGSSYRKFELSRVKLETK